MEKRLTAYSYQTEQIRVSEHIFSFFADTKGVPSSKFERAKAKIDLGNRIRTESEDNAILATAVATEIKRRRAKRAESSTTKNVQKVAYVVSSLKNPEEVAELRQIYERGFYLFAVHCDRDLRLGYLQGDKANIPAEGMLESQALSLIERDEDEKDTHGQHTRKTFHLADFFLADENNDTKLSNSIVRCFDLIFGNPLVTPTFNEFAMFMAFAASLRSADLSRQVGAVVAKGTEIISTGANDCPRPKGGLYWPVFMGTSVEDEARGRDHKRGYDSNSKEKSKLVNEIAEKIIASFKDGLEKDLRTLVLRGAKEEDRAIIEKLINEASMRRFASEFSEQRRSNLEEVLRGTGIMSITEYGRVVHAEMEALLACARNNVSCSGATLYCTTFPCHNCAKHIIAAGIESVIYVEPYPKSKAIEFHDEAVTTSKDNADGRVRFQPFIGVGPRQFFDLFSLSLSSGRTIERKDDDGMALVWKPADAIPRVQMYPFSHRQFEDSAVEYLNNVKAN